MTAPFTPGSAALSPSETSYVHAAAHDDLERERLNLLSRLHDQRTKDRITDAIDLSGAQVLEVGAGAGSVAHWLGDQVGESGQVVATDIDLRFLTRIAHPQVEVRHHDIVVDELETDRFDLIHCRFLLTHLFLVADQVIDTLVGALRPGGCLIIEEIDAETLRVTDRHHPLADQVREAGAWMTEYLRTIGAQNPEFGRTLPPILRATRLQRVTSWADYDISPPGGDYRRFLELSFESAVAGLRTAPNFEPDRLAPLLTAIANPEIHLGEMAVVGARGYRPLP